MLTKIHIKNFKSLADLTLEPGTLNVLVGANGSGKSNFLEAVAFASAAAAGKLDNEFLISRGIRVTAPEFMRSAFAERPQTDISVAETHNDGHQIVYSMHSKLNERYPVWEASSLAPSDRVFQSVRRALDDATKAPAGSVERDSLLQLVTEEIALLKSHYAALEGTPIHESVEIDRVPSKLLAAELRSRVTSFLIYAPENSALRRFDQEGQILPLGINGAGLFKLLRFLSTDGERWEELKSNLKLLDWFGDIRIAPEQAPFEQNLQIKDRFLNQALGFFDQRSANEGFLFLLFYFALMISPDTPSIFAIDNVDTSLNPKLATELIRRLATLAKKHNKQVFLTTHSPAVLDGLDLADAAQRLFAFDRKRNGQTRCRRVTLPQPVEGEERVKLSEAFSRGLLGGLPQNF